MSFYQKIKTKLAQGRKNHVRFDDNHTISDRLVAGSEFAYSDRIVHGSAIDSDVKHRAGHSELSYSDRIIHGSVINSDVVTHAAGSVGSDDGRKIAFHQNSSNDWTGGNYIDYDEPPRPKSVDGPRSPPAFDDARLFCMPPERLIELAYSFFHHPDDERTIGLVRSLCPEDLEDLTNKIRYLAMARVDSCWDSAVYVDSPVINWLLSTYRLWSTDAMCLVVRSVCRINAINIILGDDVLEGERWSKLVNITDAASEGTWQPRRLDGPILLPPTSSDPKERYYVEHLRSQESTALPDPSDPSDPSDPNSPTPDPSHQPSLPTQPDTNIPPLPNDLPTLSSESDRSYVTMMGDNV